MEPLHVDLGGASVRTSKGGGSTCWGAFCTSIRSLGGAGVYRTRGVEDGAETSRTGDTVTEGEGEAGAGRGSTFGLTFLHLHLLALLPAN